MKKNTAKVQIKQIADKLGVSSGTVSIVLNGRGDQMRISKMTQKRIQDMAKEMNYQPNIYARRLRKSAEEEAPYIIAIFWREEYLDDLLARFLKGLYHAIKNNDLNIELVLQPYDFGNLEKHHRFINSNHFNGAIVGGISNEDQQYLEQNEFDIPIVLIGRSTKKYNSVLIDYYDAGTNCANLFSMRNHKIVGLIGLSTKGKSVQLIELAFKETCKEKNILIDTNCISYCEERNFTSGYESAMKVLTNEKKPTAIFVMDGRNAFGVLKACKTVGLTVPKDIEILVFGENEYFSYSEPTITTIQQPMEQFAERSLNMILMSIKNKADNPMIQELSPIFNFRESCGGFIL
ncbi:LacI family DNA-binding transcriptional regulator [Mobilitalea sibirica]|nr:LacI family DNA-binding transcriptional regulator [Mobilitalea sibirica]